MKWIEWNRRGLIPGPGETEEAFLTRVASASRENSNFLQRTRELFDIAPDWVSIIESNRRLAFWHGAVTLIDGSQTALQVRTRPPWGYNQEELVAHELTHVGRCAFDEPKFEEFFAYRTSQSRFRRWLGPVIARPWEVWLLLGMVFAGGWIPLLPISLIIVGFTRLLWRHFLLNRCVRHLEAILGSRQRAWAVAYRLTDGEIGQAARGRLRGDDSVRWRLLRTVYGMKN